MHLGACVCTRIVFQYSIVSVFHPPLFSLPLALYLSSLAFFFFRVYYDEFLWRLRYHINVAIISPDHIESTNDTDEEKKNS